MVDTAGDSFAAPSIVGNVPDGVDATTYPVEPPPPPGDSADCWPPNAVPPMVER